MKIIVFCVLFIIQDAVCRSSNTRPCSQSSINRIKHKYIQEIREEIEDLREIEKITSECSRSVKIALKRLREDIIKARPGSGASENINNCLDELNNQANNIESSYLNSLNEKCYSKIAEDVQQVQEKVDEAISKIELCAQNSGASCKSIENCCEDVEDDFDDEDVDDEVGDLVNIYKRCVRNECKIILSRINELRSQIAGCLQLTDPAETTTIAPTPETETDNPITTTSDPVIPS